MRKLDKKNMTYIIVLSIIVFALIIGVIVFILYKINDMNTEYVVSSGSIVFDKQDEKISVNTSSIIKKNFMNQYYLVYNNEKIFLQDNPIVLNATSKNVKLIGTFYEVLENGEIDKLKGETVVDITSKDRLFKISDRKYLVTGDNIKSSDESLKTNNFIIVNIDKIGNGYLYNDKLNIKTFSDLELITHNFNFKVNSEMLTIGEEKIDLSKINGSTNTYKEEISNVTDNTTENSTGGGGSTGDGTGNSTGGGSGSGNNSDNNPSSEDYKTPEPFYPDPEKEEEPEKIVEKVIKNMYLTRKTTIVDLAPNTNSIKVSYIVYDPLSEYEKVYVKVYDKDSLITKVNIDPNVNSININELSVGTNYRLDFYYSYVDEDKKEHEYMFDTSYCATLNITGNITLDKLANNVVRYIVKVDKYKLDKFDVHIYLDGVDKGVNSIIEDNDLKAANSKNGLLKEFTLEGTNLNALSNELIVIQITDAYYNGAKINLDASYKFKI